MMNTVETRERIESLNKEIEDKSKKQMEILDLKKEIQQWKIVSGLNGRTVGTKARISKLKGRIVARRK